MAMSDDTGAAPGGDPGALAEAASALDIEALTALVVGDDGLRQLEAMLGGFNLFEAIGSVRREARHSDFLAFLLDPSEQHGLDDEFLRRVLADLVGRLGAGAAISPLDVALLDLDDATVAREWQDIDLLVVSQHERVVLLIENKVDTDLHSKQLTKYLDLVGRQYPDYRILPVFLTPDGHSPDTDADPAAERYTPLSYGDLYRIGEATLLARPALAADVSMVIRHYLTMVERHIMPDSKVADLAVKIYAKHRRALDLIFEFRPDDQSKVHDHFIGLLKAAADNVELVYDSKSYVTFVPREWLEVPILAEGGDISWTKSQRLVRFELRFQPHLSLHLLIGPGNPDVRKGLFEATNLPKEKGIYKGRSKTLGAKWTQIWGLPIKKNPWDADVDDVVATLEKEWKQFAATELPPLSASILEIGKKVSGLA
jgi:hypothetical protein